MDTITGEDIDSVEVFGEHTILVYMKNGDTLEFYSEDSFERHKYLFTDLVPNDTE